MHKLKITYRTIISCIIAVLIVVLGLKFFEFQASINFSQKSKEPDVFGASFMTLNNDYFKVINDEIENVVESNGDEFISLDATLDLQKQKEQIQYLIKKDCKIIFISPVDKDGLASTIKECSDKGIKVIAIDSGIESDDISYTVVSDNYNAGVLAAQDMMNQKESANILLLTHVKAQSAVDRIQGFVDSIEKNDNYNIVETIDVDGQLEIAMPKVEEYINNGGNSFDVIMALNDPSALGAIAALQATNKNENILVYGIDGTPEAKMLIKDNLMRCTIAQSPIQIGRRAIEIGYGILDGDQQNNIEYIPVTLINNENIDQFQVDGWQ